MWPGIWSVTTTWIGFWTLIWSTRQCGLGQEVVCWFQCWEFSSSFFWLSNNAGSINVKMYRSVLEEKVSFRILGFTFSSKLNWGSYIISVAQTTSKRIGTLIRSMNFLSPKLTPHLCKSTVHPSCYLGMLGKLQKRIFRTVGPSLAAPLESLTHC